MNIAKTLMSSVAPRATGLLQKYLPQCRSLHLLTRIPQPASVKALLQPTWTSLLVPNCGLKLKGELKRRCKDCYFVYRDKRKYVMCKAHPRHKATTFMPREKFTWVLSPGPMMSKQRPW